MVTATTIRLDAAEIVGSISTVTLLYICTGMVWNSGDRRNSARTTSSNETMNAKIPPVRMPRLISGIVTRTNARDGEEPSDAAARWFSANPKWIRIQKWFMASVLTGLAAKMALDKAK